MILCDLIVYFFISGESSPFFPHQQSPDAGGGGDEEMMVVGGEEGQATSYFAADDLFSSLLAAAETLRRNEEALLKSSGAVKNSVENGILFPPAVNNNVPSADEADLDEPMDLKMVVTRNSDNKNTQTTCSSSSSEPEGSTTAARELRQQQQDEATLQFENKHEKEAEQAKMDAENDVKMEGVENLISENGQQKNQQQETMVLFSIGEASCFRELEVLAAKLNIRLRRTNQQRYKDSPNFKAPKFQKILFFIFSVKILHPKFFI
jgi:hypothetical protein